MLSNLREKANNLPLLPGVYLMKDKDDTIIYVGKAKILKNRVSSYFRGKHQPKVEAMVNKVNDFDYIIVKSEFEALILENSLIKKYQPHYNILLKDDKGYPFIKIDLNQMYPRMEIVSRCDNKEYSYYGPYGGRDLTRDIISSISKALKLPECGRKFPDSIGKERPCLNYTMGICDGWCIEDKQQEYEKRFSQAIMILDGNCKELIQDLTNRMLEASDETRYEYAAVLRDRIRSIEGLNNKQRVTSKGSSRYFKISNSMDNNNIREKTLDVLYRLQKLLLLDSFPKRIEAFDVSNLGDSGIVAAMSVFVDGKAYKRDYKRFRIRNIETRDDYASMYQAVYRRFKRYVDGDPGFKNLPDLLLIDGGEKHASVATAAINDLGLSIPVFGMVKDGHHKTRALINCNNEEVSISSDLAVFSLVGRIQEETHRFAIEYQRTVRYENYGSELDKIPGVGNTRKMLLLKNFKSVKSIKSASLDELMKVVSSSTANSVYTYFHGDGK